MYPCILKESSFRLELLDCLPPLERSLDLVTLLACMLSLRWEILEHWDTWWVRSQESSSKEESRDRRRGWWLQGKNGLPLWRGPPYLCPYGANPASNHIWAFSEGITTSELGARAIKLWCHPGKIAVRFRAFQRSKRHTSWPVSITYLKTVLPYSSS